VIIFGSATGGLSRVSAGGGIATPLTALDSSRQENAHMLPSLLPDDRHFVYLRRSRSRENVGIYLGSLDAKPEAQDSKRLLATLAGAQYAPPEDTVTKGRLLFLREDGTLMAQPFDTGRLELAGEPVQVVGRVASNRDLGHFAVSTNGILAYRSGSGNSIQFTWFDRQGKILGTAGNPSLYYTPDPLALSPDGTRVATQRRDPQTGNVDIWVLDIARNTSTRLTSDPALDVYPVWSPDGSRIVFASNRDGPFNLYQKASTGAGEEELLLRSNGNKTPNDWSRDGRFLLYCDSNPKTKCDLWVLPLSGDRKPIPFLRTAFSETEGQFSPDGHWIAYRSNQSGKPEIYVRPFPATVGGSGQWTISNGGGTQPRWRRDGKELFYFSGEGTLMSVDLATSPVFRASIPQRLFDTRILAGDTPVLFSSTSFHWDVAANGKRFLINTATAESGSAPITVVQNWTALLKKK
jgi:dipeptidyl aminopeptidase/acylaminoacyl peptidase